MQPLFDSLVQQAERSHEDGASQRAAVELFKARRLAWTAKKHSFGKPSRKYGSK